MELPKQYNGNQTNDKQATEYATTILMLNDDCLLHLCQYLSFWDIQKFGQTCARLKSFVGNYNYPKYSSLDWNHFLKSQRGRAISQAEEDNIFEIMGPYIKNFSASRDFVSITNNNLFSTRHKNLKNLQVLSLTCFELDEYPFQECSGTFNKLKVLELCRCDGFDNTFFQLIPNVTHLRLYETFELDGFRHLKHLQQLIMDSCYSFVGDELNHLKHLQQLKIIDCENLIPEKLLDCLKENPQIVQLILRGISLSQCSGFETIISNLKLLEYLSLDNYDGWPLDKLDNLKSLHAQWCNVPSFKKLAATGQLEELKLTMCKTSADTDTDLHLYLSSLKKLKKIHFVDTAITEEFLLRMTKELDLKSLTFDGTQLTDKATVQLVKYSENLEYFYCWAATATAIKEIIKLVNEDPHRPKLVFAVCNGEEISSLLGTHDRVEISINDGFFF